jgi:hypothetical protein
MLRPTLTHSAAPRIVRDRYLPATVFRLVVADAHGVRREKQSAADQRVLSAVAPASLVGQGRTASGLLWQGADWNRAQYPSDVVALVVL